jgi:hypothetical protein
MRHGLTLVLIAAGVVGCNGATSPAPTAPDPRPEPVSGPIPIVVLPAPGTTPLPPGPTPCANGHRPVAEVRIKVHSVRNTRNELRPFHPTGPFLIGESLRFDAEGRDVYGLPTDGCTGEGPRWSPRPEELVDWNGRYGWMPSATVKAPGTLTVIVDFEDASTELRLGLATDF